MLYWDLNQQIHEREWEEMNHYIHIKWIYMYLCNIYIIWYSVEWLSCIIIIFSKQLVQYTMYNVHCPLYNITCTLDIVQWKYEIHTWLCVFIYRMFYCASYVIMEIDNNPVTHKCHVISFLTTKYFDYHNLIKNSIINKCLIHKHYTIVVIDSW